jgi:hypothetical protein
MIGDLFSILFGFDLFFVVVHKHGDINVTIFGLLVGSGK